MKPNILYIHSHDTGRYIQPYGHAIATPNLQQLAKEGVLFRQAFTSSPTCSPSRACLLTGEYPHSNGMLGLAHRGFSLNDYSKHILHTLRGQGYHCVLSGVQHIAHNTETIGYDRILSAPDYNVPPGTPGKSELKAIEFLREMHERPFFLDVGFIETHRPFPDDCGSNDPRYCLPPSPIPDTSETRLDMAKFKRSAEALDSKIGSVLKALGENGLSENTLVICTTDHGIPFPRMKCNLEDSGTGVMLIMRGPDGFSGGKVVDAMVGHVDIFPTICEYLGIEAPERLQGVSFIPLIRGESKRVRCDLFFEINYHAAFEPMRAIRTNRFKYIRRYDPRKSPVLSNCDCSLSRTVWMEYGWKDMAPIDEALYDLVFDPNEKCDISKDPKHSSDLLSMRQLLMETNDPLLDGDVPLPSKAVLDSRDSLEPDQKGVGPLRGAR